MTTFDKDAGSRTSDQEELPHDAEKEKEEQGDGSFREQGDELMRTYLSVLAEAEKQLPIDQQLRPLGNHLCSRPADQDQTVAAPIVQQVPLSQLMRHRWDENRAECVLTTCLVQDSLLDKYFWDYIDESFLGEKAVGGHKGRLELLNDLCRMLMDWFVHRRVEERQKWDPKALMDQVLGQIDGKSWALAAKGDLRQD